MGKFRTITTVISIISVAYLSKFVLNSLSDSTTVPEIPDEYFGSKTTNKLNSYGERIENEEDEDIHPFEIKTEENVLENLKSKLHEELNSGRVKAPLKGVGFEYGFNTKYLKTITRYWLNKYNWTERERQINAYPSFKTRIAGLKIHFQHVKSTDRKKYKKTKPLLLLHGWPGSFVEFRKVIPLLSEPKDSEVNFELVIPSLPGYGFSDGAAKRGLNPAQMGKIFVELMSRLGHDQFYVQGGDWGSIIANDMITLWPKNVIAMHSNMCLSNHPRSLFRQMLATLFPSIFMSPEESARFLPYSKTMKLFWSETGYMHLQATKPDTLGVGLSLSPHALAAYVLEKFSSWTNIDAIGQKDGGLNSSKFSLDDLLDNVMIYWLTNSITTSIRLYSEFMSSRYFALGLANIPVKNPVFCLVPAKEFYQMQTGWMLQDKFQNLVNCTLASSGGHFTAYEVPELFAQSVLEFFQHVAANEQ